MSGVQESLSYLDNSGVLRVAGDELLHEAGGCAVAVGGALVQRHHPRPLQ